MVMGEHEDIGDVVNAPGRYDDITCFVDGLLLSCKDYAFVVNQYQSFDLVEDASSSMSVQRIENMVTNAGLTSFDIRVQRPVVSADANDYSFSTSTATNMAVSYYAYGLASHASAGNGFYIEF